MPAADLALFAHVATRPEPELDLAQAALLIAEPEYPGLDIPRYLEQLDQLGEQARLRLEERAPTSDPPLRRVTRMLHDELGFAGNSGDYYDPRNSFLNEVLERRTGIPITLAVVILEVARRAGITAHGVGFPGHFLVRTAGPNGPLFLDPFSGRLCSRDDLRELHRQATGEERDPDPRLLEPVPKRLILLRMLNNLRGIYTAGADNDRLRGVLERIQLLSPTDEVAAQLDAIAPPRPPTPRILN
jgi:regulator of sirC expression with transglutaminase-like and TPR domain